MLVSVRPVNSGLAVSRQLKARGQSDYDDYLNLREIQGDEDADCGG